MSLARDMVMLIRAMGYDNVGYGNLPATPDSFILVRVTPGPEALRSHDVTIRERPRFQVTVRGKNYAEAETNANDIWRNLFKNNLSLNETWYLSIRPIDSPGDLGQDGQNPPRHLFVINAQVIREI